MRLFVALDLDDHIRTRIQRFVEATSGFAPEARWARAESLHITLKFIGEKPDEAVQAIRMALSSVRSKPLEITFHGCGFFPGVKLPRIFWIGLNGGPQLTSLAATIDESMFALGVPKEIHPFSPHITLARAGSGRPHHRKDDGPNRRFEQLQKKLTALSPPEFGTMTAHEFFLYQSRLSAEGSQYTKIARFELR
ncbi:MAG: RNA 2',3'-cyclic phosphodiesterase [Terriglobales bacterium]|jgi:2'-5' RNA ligase